MRIRSIKPEFWRSEDIAELDWHDRLVFIGMWSYVDDNGVGKDRIAAIAADLFAEDLCGDSTETLRRVSLALERLTAAGLITRYSVDGTRYLYVTNWEKHQLVKNPNKPRYPLPTSENAVNEESFPQSSPGSTENLPTGTGEQGNRGAEEQGNSCAPQAERETSSASPPPKRKRTPEPGSDADPDFVKFWEIYPLKKSKEAARAKWRAALKKATAAEIIAGAERYRDDPGRDPGFTAHPNTWLNQGRWADEPTPTSPRSQGDWRDVSNQNHSGWTKGNR